MLCLRIGFEGNAAKQSARNLRSVKGRESCDSNHVVGLNQKPNYTVCSVAPSKGYFMSNGRFRCLPRGIFNLVCACMLTAVVSQNAVGQGELVDLKVDSKARPYDGKNPVQAAKQEFSLSKAGMLMMVYVGEPYYADVKGGMIPLEEVNLSNFVIGTGIYLKRTPDPGIPGQRYTFEQHWLCANREKPLNLRAALQAPHRWQAFQISGRGDQLAANQVLKVNFVPFDEISSQSGPAPQVDVAGKWLHGDENAVLTFTPTGVTGEYTVVEKGYDNITGTAKVKGNKVYIDWVTTTVKGQQRKGVSIVEIKPDGTHGEGWSVGEGGVGGERWTAFPGTTAKPIGSTPGTPGTSTPVPTTPGRTTSTGRSTPGKETATGTPTTTPEPASVNAFTIQAGQREGKPGEIVTVPVYLLNPDGVANLNVTISYPSAVAQAEGKIARGNVLGNALFEANPGDSGQARIGMAGNKPLSDSGILAHIPFKIIGKPGDRAELQVTVSTANRVDGTTLDADTIAGAILILDETGGVPGDSDGDKTLTAGDALAALKMSVKLLPEKKSSDVDGDGKITSNDARMILQKVVGK